MEGKEVGRGKNRKRGERIKEALGMSLARRVVERVSFASDLPEDSGKSSETKKLPFSFGNYKCFS